MTFSISCLGAFLRHIFSPLIWSIFPSFHSPRLWLTRSSFCFGVMLFFSLRLRFFLYIYLCLCVLPMARMDGRFLFFLFAFFSCIEIAKKKKSTNEHRCRLLCAANDRLEKSVWPSVARISAASSSTMFHSLSVDKKTQWAKNEQYWS